MKVQVGLWNAFTVNTFTSTFLTFSILNAHQLEKDWKKVNAGSHKGWLTFL